MRLLIIGRHQALFEFAVKVMREMPRHNVVGIITAPAKSEYLSDEDDYRKLAASEKVPFLLARKGDEGVADFIDVIRPEIGVSLNWPTVLPAGIVNRPPLGIINAHFGDLPRFRGNGLGWALLRREPKMTLTVYRMSGAEMDAGQIIAKEDCLLEATTTIRDVTDFMTVRLPGMFVKAIDAISRGDPPLGQISSGSEEGFRTYPILPRDGKLEFKRDAESLDAVVRAFVKPYSGAYTYLLRGREVIKLYVWQSRVVCKSTIDVGHPGHVIRLDGTTGEAWVMTGGGVLALRAVSYDEESEMFLPGQVWSGNRMRLGLDAEDVVYMLFRQTKEGAGNASDAAI
jgi:methionyl-tRNA formyltransferase